MFIDFKKWKKKKKKKKRIKINIYTRKLDCDVGKEKNIMLTLLSSVVNTLIKNIKWLTDGIVNWHPSNNTFSYTNGVTLNLRYDDVSHDAWHDDSMNGWSEYLTILIPRFNFQPRTLSLHANCQDYLLTLTFCHTYTNSSPFTSSPRDYNFLIYFD